MAGLARQSGVLSTDTAPTNGTNEVQTVTVTGTPTGGTFRLRYRGNTTGTIAYNANAATVKTALEAISTIGSGNVDTSGTLSGGMLVTFKANLGKKAVGLLELANNSLTGGTSPNVTIVESTTGVTATRRGAAAGEVLKDSETGLAYVNRGTAVAPQWTVLDAGGVWFSYDLTAATATTGGAALSVANPLETALIVDRVIVRTTTFSTGASALDVGIAADGTTTSDILIDGLALGTAVKVADNLNDAGTNGKSCQLWGATQYLTGTVSATAAGVVGKVYVHVVIP